ncbi:MAG: hypothetical protein JSU86_13560 [Phycisphaerales bacterium]|nr:MAG: hypothetical protein JSU86_13560 [Phycisphaerales bacterium]
MRSDLHEHSPRSVDSKDFVIGVLSTTAAILLVGILIINTRPEQAWADGMTTSGGQYVLTVGGVGSPDEEHLYVLDARAERLVAYRFNGNRQQIEIAQGIELKDLRRAARKPTTQPRGKRPASRGRRP